VQLIGPQQPEQQVGIAARLDGRALGQAGRQGVRVQHRAHEHVHLQARQGRQVQTRLAARAATPAGAAHVQLGPGVGHENDGSLAQLACHLLEDLERAVVGQVHVVDGDDERAQGGVGLEEAAKYRTRQVGLLVGPADQRLTERALGQAQTEKAAQQPGHLRHPAVAEDPAQLGPEQGGGLLRLRVLGNTEAIAQDSGEQAIGLELAGRFGGHLGRRSPGRGPHHPEHVPTLAGRRPLFEKTGLAHAQPAHDGHELRRPEAQRAFDGGLQRSLGLLTPHERRRAQRSPLSPSLDSHPSSIRNSCSDRQKPRCSVEGREPSGGPDAARDPATCR
jgi:hypothetical protein